MLINKEGYTVGISESDKQETIAPIAANIIALSKLLTKSDSVHVGIEVDNSTQILEIYSNPLGYIKFEETSK